MSNRSENDAFAATTRFVNQSIQLTLDVNGGVFGGPDPPAEMFSAPYAVTGSTVTKTSTVFGNVTVTITPTGQITGSATNVPVAGISRLDELTPVARRNAIGIPRGKKTLLHASIVR